MQWVADWVMMQANLMPLRDVLQQPILGKENCDVKLNLSGVLTVQDCLKGVIGNRSECHPMFPM